jgi:hypothetical protein
VPCDRAWRHWDKGRRGILCDVDPHRRLGTAAKFACPASGSEDRVGRVWRAWRDLRCRSRRLSSATSRVASREWVAVRSRRVRGTTPPTPSTPRPLGRSPRSFRHAASDHWMAGTGALTGRRREEHVATKSRRPTHAEREGPPRETYENEASSSVETSSATRRYSPPAMTSIGLRSARAGTGLRSHTAM